MVIAFYQTTVSYKFTSETIVVTSLKKTILFTDSILSKGPHAGKQYCKRLSIMVLRRYANFAMVVPDLVATLARKYADYMFSKYSQHDQQN